MKTLLKVFPMMVLFWCVKSVAYVETVTVADLIDFIERYDKNRVEHYAADKLKERVERNGRFMVDSGQYIWAREHEDTGEREIKEVCTKFKLYDQTSDAILNNSSTFTLTATALNEPVTLTSNAGARIEYDARVRFKKGVGIHDIFFGHKCTYAGAPYVTKRVKAVFTARGDFKLELNVNPFSQQLSNGGIRLGITPDITLSGEIKNFGAPRIDIENGGIVGGLANEVDKLVRKHVTEKLWKFTLDSRIFEEIADRKTQERLEEQQVKLTTELAETVLSSSEFANWSYGDPIRRYFDLPRYTAQGLLALAEYIQAEDLQFPLSSEFLNISSVQEDLFYALIVGDSARVGEILGQHMACELSLGMTTNLSMGALPSGVTRISQGQFCLDQSGDNSRNLGNASGLPAAGSGWYITPGTNFDVGVKSIVGNAQPFMKRFKYKTVRSKISGRRQSGEQCYYNSDGYIAYCGPGYEDTYYGDGYCELEMRVYTNNINATSGKKPLIAIHGGSYRYRGFGFLGMESQVSHFTDQDYVVFAPFYRLVGTSNGNTECNKATGADIISDVKSALTWVENNASRFGASGKVSVFGQSAGAHMAAYLAVHEKTRIKKAWLVYPPNDFKHYLENELGEVPTDGSDVLMDFLSHIGVESFTDLKNKNLLTHSFVLENSLGEIISNSNVNSFPPMFIMHGTGDSLVPVSQSEYLCEALSGYGRVYDARYEGESGYSGNTCGNENNRLYLFDDAEHIMDFKCIDDNSIFSDTCRAGSQDMADAIGDAYTDALDWLDASPTSSTPPSSSGSSSGGSSSGGSAPSGSSCQWQSFTGGGGGGYTVIVYQAVGACTDRIKEEHYQNGVLVNVVYHQ